MRPQDYYKMQKLAGQTLGYILLNCIVIKLVMLAIEYLKELI